MIRILFGWRGVRIGEASNPGPQSNARRVPGASQLSGGSTQAAVSRDVRDVLRSVPDSDRTVVDVSDSARSGNRLAPLSEPSGDRRRRLVLVSQQEVQNQTMSGIPTQTASVVHQTLKGLMSSNPHL